jgi:ElaB/YqjD/DUF883 family membrane-anchored ribosome-binding protein
MPDHPYAGSGGTHSTLGETAEEAKAKAQILAEETKKKAQEMGGGLGEGTEETREQARGIKDRVLGEISQRAKSIAGEKKSMATKGLEDAVQAFRKTSENLKGEDKESAAMVLDRVADQVDRFSSYLSGKETDQLVDEIEASIRQRPGIALGTAFLVGFLAARFLKSSDSQTQRFTSSHYDPGYKTPVGWGKPLSER